MRHLMHDASIDTPALMSYLRARQKRIMIMSGSSDATRRQ